MSNGTTALPVSPVQEEEMSKLSQMIARMANAVVNETNLAKQVEALTAQVNKLTDEVNQKAMHAQELDQTIHDLRQRNNELNIEIGQTLHDLQAAKSKADLDAATISGHEVEIANLRTELAQVKADRDDHGLRSMQLEDDLKHAKQQIADFKEKIGGLASLLNPKPATEPLSDPKPEPVVIHDAPADIGAKPIEASPEPWTKW